MGNLFLAGTSEQSKAAFCRWHHPPPLPCALVHCRTHCSSQSFSGFLHSKRCLVIFFFQNLSCFNHDAAQQAPVPPPACQTLCLLKEPARATRQRVQHAPGCAGVGVALHRAGEIAPPGRRARSRAHLREGNRAQCVHAHWCRSGGARAQLELRRSPRCVF